MHIKLLPPNNITGGSSTLDAHQKSRDQSELYMLRQTINEPYI